MVKKSDLLKNALQTPHNTDCLVLNEKGYCFYASGKYQYLKNSKVSQFEQVPFFQSSKNTWKDLKPGQSLYYPCVSLGESQERRLDISVKKEFWDQEVHYVCFIKDQTEHYKGVQKLQQSKNEQRIWTEAQTVTSSPITTLHKVLFEFDGGYEVLLDHGIQVQSMIGNHYSCTLTNYQIKQLYQLSGVRVITIHPPIT